MAFSTRNLLCYVVRGAGHVGWLTEDVMRDPSRPFSWSMPPQVYPPDHGGLKQALADARRHGGARVAPLYQRRPFDSSHTKANATACGIRSAAAARVVRGAEKAVRQAARREVTERLAEYMAATWLDGLAYSLDFYGDWDPGHDWWDALEDNSDIVRHWPPKVWSSGTRKRR